jgi:2-polyprenyl-6-methoxyphenol hydroxylase-like FAD-dependent oxidoreductase
LSTARAAHTLTIVMNVRRALVVGGSMAGMLAARALADHVPVTLLERDDLPDGPQARRGLPQAPHMHTLLARGMTLLERMLPGLRRELIDDGAIPFDWGTELGWLGPFGWAAPFGRGAIESLWATRDLLDARVRAYLRRDRRIEWMDRVRVEGLLLDAAGQRVCGVRTGAGHVIEAKLVVDATGRTSRLPAWLRTAGFAAPAETSIDSRTVIATALARLARPLPNGWKALFVMGPPPHTLPAAAIGPIEGGRVLVSMATPRGDPTPAATSEFAAFGRQMRAPIVGDVLEGAEWLTPARTARSTANVRRHYEHARLPPGLLVMGDALCAFNPIFGQGITVAALQADTLSDLLHAHGPDDPQLGAIATRAFVRAADFPWRMATRRGHAPVADGRSQHAVVDGYMCRLFALAARDPDVSLRLSRVFNLMGSPLSLCAPQTVWRALHEQAPLPLLGPVGPPAASGLLPVEAQAASFAPPPAASRQAS